MREQTNNDGVKYSDIAKGKREFIETLIAKGNARNAQTKQVTHSQEQTDIFAWVAKTLMATFRFLVVTARAGVGKTYTIMISLLNHCPEVKQGLPVLYVVFNKRNQVEAESKIVNPCIQVKTWHSVGYGLLARHWGRIRGNDSVEWTRIEAALNVQGYTIANGRIKVVGKQDCPKQVAFQIVKLVSILKNYLGIPSTEFALKMANLKDCLPTDKQEKEGFTVDLIVKTAIEAMKLALVKERSGEISFGDMGGWLPCELGIVKPSYRFIAADEGQDLNEVQFELFNRLMMPDGRGMIVGDDKQGIYTWRGAVCNHLFVMLEKLKACELKLTQTFRCGKAIVKEANTLVPDYFAHEGNGEGIVEHCNEDAMLVSAKVGDAILSRLNAPLMKLCLQFIRAKKSAKIEGRDIGKMLISLVESLEATNDNFADKLNMWEQTRITKASGWNATKIVELVQDQAAALRVLWEQSQTISDMLQTIESLFQDSASKYAKPCILLSSVHKAKGLEWDKVFLLQDTFNRSRPDATPESAQEEKNIQYVAITRARNTLVWVR